MAHGNGTSSLNRTRSPRAPGNVSKPGLAAARPAAPAAAPAAATTATSTSTSTASAVALPTAPSNISLFLTNLRLLDLDLRPDWPDINPHTFGARDAVQGQKKRIQSVEWALYHLFSLWDPDEARAKLQPFFPPLDQVQSLNLRAALLRGLEQAKKNGVLGRDAVVRRTMLDECRGERLEEVLAGFSSAVLRKAAAEQQPARGGHPALAQTIALENRGYSGDRADLAALILAHRVSLCRTLDEKKAARARFAEFSDLLAAKEKALLRRRDEAAAAKRSGQRLAVTEAQKRDVWRALRNNWTGSERWMEALVYGDSKARKDGLLTAPYDRVWRRVESGRLAELEDTSDGLLQQLDSRVQEQQERLEKWHGLRERLFGKTDTQPAADGPERPPKKKGINLGFTAHEALHIDRMSPRKLQSAKPTQPDSHYEALVNGLRSDLARISPAVPSVPAFFRKPRRIMESPQNYTHGEAEAEVISDLSDLEDARPMPRPSPSRREPIRVSEEPAFEPVLRKAQTFDEEHAFPEDAPPTPTRPRRSATTRPHQPYAKRRTAQDSSTTATAPNPPSAPEARPTKPRRRATSPPPRTRSPPRHMPASPELSPSPPEQRPVSPTQLLADQILASVGAASPSPAKKRHTLSLAERTRLSLARRTSHANLRVPADEDGFVDGDDGDDHDEVGGKELEDEEEEEEEEERPETGRPAVKRASLAVPVVAEPAGDGDDPAYEDLAARTRRSMAGCEAARQRAQRERRRSLRKSKQGGSSGYFPAVDEEEGGNTTLLLAEELISDGRDQDYEAVFMSRPKLKTSPIGTPVREFWD